MNDQRSRTFHVYKPKYLDSENAALCGESDKNETNTRLSMTKMCLVYLSDAHRAVWTHILDMDGQVNFR